MIITVSLFSAGQIVLQILILFLLLSVITWESLSYLSHYLARQNRLRSLGFDRIVKGADPIKFDTLDYGPRDNRNRSQEQRAKSARLFEELVMAIFRSNGFETIRDATVSTTATGSPLDLIAIKDNIAFIVEAKNREITSPDVSSFLGKIKASDTSSLLGNRSVVHLLVGTDYSKALTEIAKRRGVQVATIELLPSIASTISSSDKVNLH